MLKIPLLDANSQLVEIDLDNNTYFLGVDWNPEGEFWTLSIEDYNHSAIVSGACIVPDSPLIFRHKYLPVPPGEFVAVTKDKRNVISRDDFSSGAVSLIYIEASEVIKVG